jgi:hypothetical protein
VSTFNSAIYIPPDHILFLTALDQAASAWFPDWAAAIPVSPEQKQALDLYMHARDRQRIWRKASPTLRATLTPLTSREEELARETPEIKMMINRVNQERASLAERVWSRVRNLLFSGELPAYIINDAGKMHEIIPEFWGGSHLKLDYFNRNKTISAPYVFSGKPIKSKGLLLINKSELENVLSKQPARPVTHLRSSPDQNPTSGESGSSVVNKPKDEAPSLNKGGAPPKWAEFLIEAFVIAEIENGTDRPNDAIELRKRTMDRWAEMGREPISEEWARKLIDPLWKRVQKEYKR